jgi:hypothetical protein
LKIQEQFLADWHEKKPEELELAERANRLITAPRLVIPEVTEKIDKALDKLVTGDETEFVKLIDELSG